MRIIITEDQLDAIKKMDHHDSSPFKFEIGERVIVDYFVNINVFHNTPATIEDRFHDVYEIVERRDELPLDPDVVDNIVEDITHTYNTKSRAHEHFYLISFTPEMARLAGAQNTIFAENELLKSGHYDNR